MLNPTEGRLTVSEKQDLKYLEKVVENGLTTFIEVGKALAKIQQNKLYRDKWKTFEAYVEDRFGITKRRAYQLIDATKTVETVSDVCTMVPFSVDEIVPNERAARAISEVPEEQLQEVLDEVVVQHQETGKPVTGKSIKEAAKKVAEKTNLKPDPKEQLKLLKNTALQHYREAMRIVDEMQRIKKETNHRKVVDLNTQLQDEVSNGWK